MPKAWGVHKLSDAQAALAASEQKLAESTQWLEMMGLSWESDQSRYSLQRRNWHSSEDRQNPKLKQIAKLAGRFKQIAERKRRSKAKDALAR